MAVTTNNSTTAPPSTLEEVVGPEADETFNEKNSVEEPTEAPVKEVEELSIESATGHTEKEGCESQSGVDEPEEKNKKEDFMGVASQKSANKVTLVVVEPKTDQKEPVEIALTDSKIETAGEKRRESPNKDADEEATTAAAKASKTDGDKDDTVPVEDDKTE